LNDHVTRAQPTDAPAFLDRVIHSRATCRSFRPLPVPRALLEEILAAARMAPSTFNTQPWRVHVLAGEAKRALSDAIAKANEANTEPAFSPFPSPAPADCAARQTDFGKRYYGALRIDHEDMAARARQTRRNFEFFDAPVGLIFTIDRSLTQHSWLDCGLFMQTLMLAAQVRGVSTCPQVSFVRFERVITQQLDLAPEEAVICGMSMGYANDQAPVNKLAMPREPVSALSRWLGFD
jgi:nitroreductase